METWLGGGGRGAWGGGRKGEGEGLVCVFGRRILNPDRGERGGVVAEQPQTVGSDASSDQPPPLKKGRRHTLICQQVD